MLDFTQFKSVLVEVIGAGGARGGEEKKLTDIYSA